MDGLYEGGGGKPDAHAGTKGSVDEENAQHDENQILISKKSLGEKAKEFKVGDEIVFKIVGDHGEEFSAVYATEEGSSGEGESANAELDGMSQSGAGRSY